MTGVIPTIPRIQFFSAQGNPLAGGKLYTYSAGTTKPEATYQDQNLTIKNENPIRLDSSGSCALWLDPSKNYKFVLKNSLGTLLPGWPVDNISGAAPGALAGVDGTKNVRGTWYGNVTASVSDLGKRDGSALIGFCQPDNNAMPRSLQDKAQDTVSILDFMSDTQRADVRSGAAALDHTVNIQMAYVACALAGKIPVFGCGTFRITSPIDAKGLPLIGAGRNHSTVLCNVGTGTRTFTNVGQVVENLRFKGPGGGLKPDAFSTDGYKRYIRGNFFENMGDCICSTAIFVTTVITQNEFLNCESAVNDKLQDGTNAHTTLWFTHNNVLYTSKAFDMRTEAAGFVVQSNVFENLYVVYEGNGKQLFGSLFSGNWVEQMTRSVTLLSNTFAGGTNIYQGNQLRPGNFAILDASKWSAAQFALTGTASGGGGGVAIDTSGVRTCDAFGIGHILAPDGIKPSAAMANFSNAADTTIATQNANANQASRGGDLVFDGGKGSLGQRRGALRPIDDALTEFGTQQNRWAKLWGGYLKGSGNGGYVAPDQAAHELSNNQPNGTCLATYNADPGSFAVCHQSEFAGSGGAVNGAGFLYLGKSGGAITYRVTANGNVTNTNNSYGAISDIKLKENIVDATPKLDDLMRVRIVNYSLKGDAGLKQLGVIAQELEQVFPGMVEQTPDCKTVERERAIPVVLGDDGEEIEPARTEPYTEIVPTGEHTKHVKYSIFVPMLIKALQEATARIEALEAKVR